ncbi:MAG: carbohydrate binding domain-containing protein [Candidatus Omnitrophota bacterium]|nr:carbohydrate binding domain-containing protein [Candidatus Omnitrophota bacterium]
MGRMLLVFALILILTVPAALTGCGQKQEVAQAPVIKPMEVTSEDEEADIEEEDLSANMPAAAAPAVSGSVKTVTESAIDKASAIQESQEKFNVQPAAAAAVEAPKPSEMLVLADFDSGEKPNNVGGNFGAWNKDPSDPTQWCKEGFDNVVRHGDKGFAMKLNYCVDSPNPAYNGFWMMLPNLDASKYDTINLWVKGDTDLGYTTVFKIEIKNAAKQTGRYYISNASDQWQQISIPLSEFKSLIDRTNLTEFVIVFEDRMATNKKGAIYIDDITFTKK